MPCLTIGKGAKVDIKLLYLHPIAHINYKYVNVNKDKVLEDYKVMQQAVWMVKQCQQFCYILNHLMFMNNVSSIKFYAVQH